MATITPIISVPELAGITSLKWHSAEQTGTELTTTTILHGKADRQELFNNSIFNSLSESRIGEYGYYAGHQINYGYGKYDELTITCVDLTVATRDGYYSKFELSNRTEGRPLEEKRDVIETGDDTVYRLWWNHEVRAAEGTAALSAGQIATLRTVKNISEGTGISGYYWVRSNQAKKSNEDVMMDCAFPGVQTYGVPQIQVKEIIYTRTESVMRDLCDQVGKKLSPRYADGLVYDATKDTDEEWLVTSASYRKALGWFEGSRTYAYALGGWLKRYESPEGTSIPGGTELPNVYPEGKHADELF